MNKRDKFHLVDYKGKFNIICDELDEMDYPVGEITRKEAIDVNEASWRNENARYYGVPAYIGKDKELNKIYE